MTAGFSVGAVAAGTAADAGGLTGGFGVALGGVAVGMLVFALGWRRVGATLPFTVPPGTVD